MLVGGSGVLVNSAFFFVLYQFLGLPLIAASALSVEVAIANNFIWNDRWTFRRVEPQFARFLKFNLVSLAGMALTAATGWLLVQQADVNYLLANLAGITLASACNFLLNIAWTWRGLMPGVGAP